MVRAPSKRGVEGGFSPPLVIMRSTCNAGASRLLIDLLEHVFGNGYGTVTSNRNRLVFSSAF